MVDWLLQKKLVSQWLSRNFGLQSEQAGAFICQSVLTYRGFHEAMRWEDTTSKSYLTKEMCFAAHGFCGWGHSMTDVSGKNKWLIWLIDASLHMSFGWQSFVCFCYHRWIIQAVTICSHLLAPQMLKRWKQKNMIHDGTAAPTISHQAC